MRPRIFRRSNKIFAALLAAVLLAGSGVSFADAVTDSLDAALKQAAERHAPVLVDFYAPWCYSCYFMAKNVKTGPEWEYLERKAIVLELDADAPDGAYWMKQWGAKGLPSYVVLDEKGSELGRISLERTRAQFYPEIDAIIARGVGFETLQARVKDGSPASVAAAREVLQGFHARRDPDSARQWRQTRSPATQAALDRDTAARWWTARLDLQRAAQQKDGASCAVIAPQVFAGELGCDRAYEIDRVLGCTESLPVTDKKKLFAAQQPAMEKLLAGRVFIKTPACADARSVISSAADLAEAIGDEKTKARVLDRAIRDAEMRLGGPAKLDLKKDRNLADNLRVYLDQAGRIDELDALFPKLIAAYPDDYVYAYRFGKSLAARGEYAKALPYLEQAAPKAYGVNRINVAQLRAETLLKLGRAEDAKQVVADALKANGPFFPELTAKLKAIVANNG